MHLNSYLSRVKGVYNIKKSTNFIDKMWMHKFEFVLYLFSNPDKLKTKETLIQYIPIDMDG